MSRKRRVFHIDLPDEPEETFPAGKVEPEAPPPPAPEPEPEPEAPAAPRRGPMASAVRETAEALAERRGQEAKIRAENDALAAEHVRLKRAGLITDLVPLEAIRVSKLMRDRRAGADPELEELKESIRAVGLSNPIRVEQGEDGSFELIQGFRRLSAYKALLEETGDAAWARIPAGFVPRGEDLPALYRRMVDENMVRKDISFAEMAELARVYAADPRNGVEDVDAAVPVLFRSASYQKRSYIRAFAQLLDLLGDALHHPEAIPRSLGLALRKRIEEVEGVVGALRRELGRLGDCTAEEELAVLRRYAAGGAEPQESFPAGKVAKGGAVPRPARTTFRLELPEGEARCTASRGRLELRLDRDFSEVERRRLEAAVAAFFRTLDA
ncbi:ParB/RepB/Spo0J family partition protein [Oceanicella sp. SM1341]|uniref:ParB/RepB/Spo0J family partition protein n=1 Tax=Oceanicella sp. SM1341 TaxID=1548889 RepID=UPI000E4FD75D|nr:ParB/RepB/Spo0J family partition protein [Oceanicella sp. SM1341]